MNSIDPIKKIFDRNNQLLLSITFEQKYIANHWKIYFLFLLFNSFVSLFNMDLTSDNELSIVSQFALSVTNILFVYFFGKIRGIDKIKIMPLIFIFSFTLLFYIYGIDDYLSQANEKSFLINDNFLNKYDRLISGLIEIILLIELISGLIKLNGHILEKQEQEISDNLKINNFQLKISNKNIFYGISSEIFKRHTIDDVENVLSAGLKNELSAKDGLIESLPKPWLFFWIISRCLIIYLIFILCWQNFSSLLILPSLMFIGTLAFPLATLIFFFEINLSRNISIFRVVQICMIGGAISLLISLFFYEFISPITTNDFLMGASAGFVEEFSKLIALLLVLKFTHENHLKYGLNALLLGAAVGTGFDVFESMGYAFRDFLEFQSDSKNNIFTYDMSIIYIRALTSPFCHIPWTAMTALGYWKAYKISPKFTDVIRSSKLIGFSLLAALMHSLWDIETSFDEIKLIFLCIASFLLTWWLIKDGYKEFVNSK